MEHCGYVVEVKELRKHSNADRLLIATFFREDVVVGLDTKVGDKGVFFPCDLQLSLDFCVNNNLLRVMPDGTAGPGYMDPDKRNVKAIKLRGEKSSGLYLPISCLAYTGADLNSFNIGDTITSVNGMEICRKYIPIKSKGERTVAGGAGARTKRRAKRTVAPTFFEHKDTEQLAYNLGEFKPGDDVEITLKVHGTSQRTAYVPVLQENKYETNSYMKGIILNLLPKKSKLFEKLTEKWCKNTYQYDYISGTRRTVMDTFEGGFYGSNEFREPYHEFFKGKLWKGETVYYEVVGYTHDGKPIMASGDTPKDYVSTYGKKMEFSYGCSPTGYHTYEDGSHEELPQSRIFVYRMCMVNEDGDVVEYTPDFMRYRCEQMGVETVPVLWGGIIPEKIPIIGNNDEMGAPNLKNIDAGEYVILKAEEYYDGPDPIGKTHIREGVVVRILNRPTFKAYKHKNWCFKCVEGLVKETADAPDMEEADGLDEEEASADVEYTSEGT